MEFLKGLQEALAMGLTKEQYIDVWKTDKIAQGLPLNSDYRLSTGHQEMENAKAKLVDHNTHSSSLDLKQLKEYNDHFLSTFSHMFDQLKENQEQHRQHFQHKHDQMMEEVRSRFNLLSDHISDVADCTTNSLKVYVMQELGLFKQELQQMIHEGSVKHGCDPDQNSISRNVQDQDIVGISECRSEATSNKDSIEKYSQREYSKTQDIFGAVRKQESSTDLNVYQKNYIQNGIPNFEDRLENGAQNSTPLMDVMKFINGKVESNMTDMKSMSANQHDPLLVIPAINTKLAEYLNAGCVENTMLCVQSIESHMSYAQVAKSQTKKSASGNTFSAGSRALSVSSVSLNSMQDSTDTPTLSISEFPNGSQVFRVKASERNVVFLSPAMYSCGIPVQGRFRGSFDAEGKLKISLHARISGYNRKMPLILSGDGSVYHHASKHFSPLWQLLPTTFHEATSDDMECAFNCDVCLTTGRGKYPDVTYDQLAVSRFIENDILTIRCNLKASTELL